MPPVRFAQHGAVAVITLDDPWNWSSCTHWLRGPIPLYVCWC
jgi:hypothetical protein